MSWHYGDGGKRCGGALNSREFDPGPARIEGTRVWRLKSEDGTLGVETVELPTLTETPSRRRLNFYGHFRRSRRSRMTP